MHVRQLSSPMRPPSHDLYKIQIRNGSSFSKPSQSEHRWVRNIYWLNPRDFQFPFHHCTFMQLHSRTTRLVAESIIAL